MSKRLFDGFKYFDHKFPPPQSLGAKFVALDWIQKFIPHDVRSVLDAFSGSQSVSFYLKQLGFQTITNDFLNFNNQIGKALIENSSEQLSDNDLTVLFQESPNKGGFTLIENLFTDIFFQREEAIFLEARSKPRLGNLKRIERRKIAVLCSVTYFHYPPKTGFERPSR